jgi:lysozyme
MTPLEALVARHEGYRQHLYRCTSGKLTIGYGLNLEAGLPEDEARLLMSYRLRKIRERLSRAFPWFDGLGQIRKDVLISMAYQMGLEGLFGFRKMLDAVEKKQWDRASYEMLDSRWAKEDTPERAKELSLMMKHGVDSVG